MKSTTIGGLALALSMGSAHATQFVQNGDFTQLSNGIGQFDTNTTASGWSGGGGYNFVFNTADQASPGIYGDQFGGTSLWDAANGGASNWDGKTASGVGNFAALDGDFGTRAITQTISGLTPGAQYYLSFNFAFSQQEKWNGDTLQNLTVGFGNNFTTTTPTFDLAEHSFSGWKSDGMFVTANSNSEVLSFLAYGNVPVPPFALVSDVSLTGGVPELSTWAMMLTGFAGLGFAGYRRRAKALARSAA
jgi:hypothetical protein